MPTHTSIYIYMFILTMGVRMPIAFICLFYISVVISSENDIIISYLRYISGKYIVICDTYDTWIINLLPKVQCNISHVRGTSVRQEFLQTYHVQNSFLRKALIFVIPEPESWKGTRIVYIISVFRVLPLIYIVVFPQKRSVIELIKNIVNCSIHVLPHYCLVYFSTTQPVIKRIFQCYAESVMFQ